jgi:hypothetical protein
MTMASCRAGELRIQNHYMETPFVRATLRVVLGGGVVASGVLISGADRTIGVLCVEAGRRIAALSAARAGVRRRQHFPSSLA